MYPPAARIAPARPARSLHCSASVPSLVAILTLATSAAAHDGVRALERLPLPLAPAAVQALPLESRVVLVAPAEAPRLARALRALAPSICPRVEESPGEVRLGCRTNRLAAALVTTAQGPALELRELTGLPASGDEGFPLLPFDVTALGLGTCPGESPAVRAECLLGRGDRAGARQALALASGAGERGLAALRLGDLAALDGDPTTARALWQQVSEEPWKRLAAARLCQDRPCAGDPTSDSTLRTDGLAEPLAIDLLLHGARALAFRGRPAAAAASLLALPAACEAATLLCRRILLAALHAGPEQALPAVGSYLSLPGRERGPLAGELAGAVADRAEENGAPGFAAGLLAATTGQVTEAELPAHLLRAAELYVAAGDGVRAGVVTEYARVHLGPGALRSSRWAAVARAGAALRKGRPPAPPPAAPAPAAPRDPSLARADLALARARALTAEAIR